MALQEEGLYLLPNLLHQDGEIDKAFCKEVFHLVPLLDGLLAESEKGGRHFLRHFSYPNGRSFRDIPIQLVNEHSSQGEMKQIADKIEKGGKWGLVSDSGLPILADPGSHLVALCQRKRIAVHPFPGPSALLYGLFLSGFSGQKFAFHGYLPRPEGELKKTLLSLEKTSISSRQTQIFIEAPYRTEKLVECALSLFHPKTKFALFWELTSPKEGGRIDTVENWLSSPLPSMKKKMAIFLLEAGHR